MHSFIKTIVILICAILYFCSLFVECYTIDGEKSIGSFGIMALLLGWLNGSTFIPWFANLLFISAFTLFYRSRLLALIFSALALVSSLSFLLIIDLIKNEAGQLGKVDGYLVGYWLWQTSIGVLFILSLIQYFTNEKEVDYP